MCFFFNDTATTEIYTLSLHDALPIYLRAQCVGQRFDGVFGHVIDPAALRGDAPGQRAHIDDASASGAAHAREDRKSTRLNSSHANISYAVFCLKKKKKSFTKRSTSFC